MTNERLAGIGYGLIAAVIWGGFPVVTRLGVTHSTLDSYDIVFVRFIVSGILLLPVLLRGKLNGLGLVPALVLVVGAGAPYILLLATALSRAPVGYFALTPGSMIAFTAILGRFVIKDTLSTAQIQAVYQGVLVSILGLYFFSKAVSILGPAIGATFAALVPLLATIEAALLLKEQPHALTLAGIAVVTIGMVASLVKRWDRPRQAASA